MEINEVEKEAKKYAKSISKNDTYKEYLEKAVIYGANSKYVQKKILEAQIDVYQECLYYIEENYNEKLIIQKINKLQQQLKELEDGK